MGNREVNVLVIVEGDLEEQFFKQISEIYDLNINIYCFCTNIYALYNEIRKYDFNCDIKDVLRNMKHRSDNVEILSKTFAYTYLIFDCDSHHAEPYQKGKDILELAIPNMGRLKEMADYFTNETDPSIGKLYINFPMMESFKDADSFFDEKYAGNFISVYDFKDYKSIVGTKRISSKRIDSYTKNEFQGLLKMNLYKLLFISECTWGGMDYSKYTYLSPSSKIVAQQLRILKKYKQIGVLNTALFFVIDYFGNNHGFFDSILLEHNASNEVMPTLV